MPSLISWKVSRPSESLSSVRKTSLSFSSSFVEDLRFAMKARTPLWKVEKSCKVLSDDAYSKFLEALDDIEGVTIRNLLIDSAIFYNPGVLEEFLCRSSLQRILGQCP